MVKFVRVDEAAIRKVDDATIINDYDFKVDSFDIVGSFINGLHGPVRNRVSSKTYIIASGSGKFDVDGKIYKIGADDIITVEKNEWVKIEGKNLKIFEIVNPVFNPDDEDYK